MLYDLLYLISIQNYPLEAVSDQLNNPAGTLYIGAGAGPYHLTRVASEVYYTHLFTMVFLKTWTRACQYFFQFLREIQK